MSKRLICEIHNEPLFPRKAGSHSNGRPRTKLVCYKCEQEQRAARKGRRDHPEQYPDKSTREPMQRATPSALVAPPCLAQKFTGDKLVAYLDNICKNL